MKIAPLTALASLSLLALGTSQAQSPDLAPPTLIYGVAANGELQWYRHNGALTGTPASVAGAFSGPKTVGYGWNTVSEIFSGGGQGVIYLIANDGTLNWAKHTAFLSGRGFETPGSWANPAMKVVGYGWNKMQHVFAAGGGIIYTIAQDGKLRWYKHNGFVSGNGFEKPGSWDPASGRVVGYGWGNLKHVFSGGNGVIYLIAQDGTLSWARHTAFLSGRGFETPGSWATPNARPIGTGWSDVTQVFSGGNGVIYAVKPGGELVWNRFSGYETGEGSWAENYGRVVGSGWNSFSKVFGF